MYVHTIYMSSALVLARAALAVSRAAKAARIITAAGKSVKTVAPYAVAGKAAYKIYKDNKPPSPPTTPKNKPKSNYKGKAKGKNYTSTSTQTAKTAAKKKRLYYTRASEVKKDSAGPNPTFYDKEYNMKGSVKINEHGGSISSNGTGSIYIHHAVASTEVIRSVYRAIIKRIFIKRGIDIRNWDEIPSGSGSGLTCTIYYYATPSQNSNARLSMTWAVPTNQAFSTLADSLMNFVRNNTSINVQEINIEFDSIYVANTLRNSTDTGSVDVPIDMIDLKNMNFDIKVKSELVVMNRTLAEPNAGDTTQDRDDTTNIDVVPLKGKVYSGCDSWRNFIDLQTRAQAAAAYSLDFDFAKKLVADPVTGLIQWVSQPGIVGNNGQLLGVPPKGYILGYKADKGVFIRPGGISKNTFTFVTTMSFNKIVHLFPQHFTVVSTNSNVEGMRRKFGFIQGYGLEKYLDANRAAGAEINIAYQIKQTYCCLQRHAKRVPSNPIQFISQTPINYVTDKPT